MNLRVQDVIVPNAGERQRPSIPKRELLRLALFYGIAGFGGGYSVLAQLRRRLVDEKAWLDADEFLVLAELSKSLPGTPATSLLALLGQRVGGTIGGLVAACAFLLPSMILMIGFGAAYGFLRNVAALAVFFDGMNAAMVGVVAATTLDLARSALKNRYDVAAAVACGALLATRVVTEPIVALAAIAIGVARAAARPKPPPDGQPPPLSERLHGFIPLPIVFLGAGLGVIAGLVRVFGPIGVLTFGGGLAMVPAIEHRVVVEQHWIGPKTFADAVALGQVTPGPVAICATFIGYRVGGVVGALVASVAMFGPAIALALVVGSSVDRFRRSPFVVSALRALAPAVIGMLVAATYSLARNGIDDRLDIGLAIVAFALGVFWRRLSPLWLLLGGGLIHLLATQLHLPM
jgi:chromate transporter